MPSDFSNLRPLPAMHLRIIRFAMLAAMLLFVGVAQVVHSKPDAPPPSDNLPMLRWVGFGLCAFAMIAIVLLRNVRQRTQPERRGTIGLIGSAFGEGAGFMGAVYFFMGGDLAVFAAALVVFLASWVLLPADPETV